MIRSLEVAVVSVNIQSARHFVSYELVNEL